MFARLQQLFALPAITLIAFDPKWNNGTGYMDGAAKGPYAPALSPGQIVKSMSDDSRLMILVGTPAGNVVFFQHHTHGSMVVKNMSRGVAALLPELELGNAVTAAMFDLLFGNEKLGITSMTGAPGVLWNTEPLEQVETTDLPVVDKRSWLKRHNVTCLNVLLTVAVVATLAGAGYKAISAAKSGTPAI